MHDRIGLTEYSRSLNADEIEHGCLIHGEVGVRVRRRRPFSATASGVLDGLVDVEMKRRSCRMEGIRWREQ